MFVCLFVCPHNYLNDVPDIIKVRFCQLRLVVCFNNIPPRTHTKLLHFWCLCLIGCKIASFCFISGFFVLLGVKSLHSPSLHFWFLCLIGCKIASFPIFSTLSLISFTYFHRWNRFISGFLCFTYFHLCLIGHKIAFITKFKEK